MAKFIIEVSDGYIRERANIENIVNTAKDTICGLGDFFAFGGLEKALDEGTNDFYISSKDLDEQERGVFNRAMSFIAAIVTVKICEKKIKEENENGNVRY